MCGEELEGVDLEERRVEEQLDGGGPLLGVGNGQVKSHDSSQSHLVKAFCQSQS